MWDTMPQAGTDCRVLKTIHHINFQSLTKELLQSSHLVGRLHFADHESEIVTLLGVLVFRPWTIQSRRRGVLEGVGSTVREVETLVPDLHAREAAGSPAITSAGNCELRKCALTLQNFAMPTYLAQSELMPG